MYFPKDEYEARWAAVYAELRQRGYDTAVIWQRTGGGYDRAGNVWYLANYASHNIGQEQSEFGVGQAYAALLLHAGNEPELHVLRADYSEFESIERRHLAIEQIVAHTDNLAAGLAAHLVRRGVEGRVAYVGDDFLPAQMYRPLLAGSPGIEWIPEEDLMYRLQSHASSREQELYREIGDISSRALTAFMDGLVRGDRQCDAAAEAGKIVIAAGGGFQRLGCHTGPRGDHAAWDYPLYGYSREAASRGEFVRAWVVGPVLEGYWIDPGRTSVCGLNPTSAQRALIEEAITTVNRITDEVRPGRTPREVGAIVDATTDRSDLGIYGHGLSTFWLGPLIPAQPFEPDPGDTLFDADEPFRDGQIFTSETFISEPGVGTAGFEDVFIVREGGNELLTTTPQLFW